ncbi:MAG: hypothetical protein ACYDAL_03370 [Candidatus Dormibacteraceae bacterium]
MAASSISSSPPVKVAEPLAEPIGAPLTDPIGEGRRLIDLANQQRITIRLLGSIAVHMKAPPAGLLLARPIRDIDMATPRGSRTALTGLLASTGYVADQMFNALHGARRLLFYDPAHERKLDVFVGQFCMCHAIPITDRLDRDPLTVPLAELLLTKLQIVELTERDQRDIYNLCFHHDVSSGDSTEIEGDYIAEICARDWGLWRTAKATIERCRTNLTAYDLEPETSALIRGRLDSLWSRIEQTPKSTKWRLRSRIGDRLRWYDEPEEHASSDDQG